MNVLIVEDETDSVTLLIRQLEKFDFDIDVANDGEEAWAKLRSNTEYSLVLLDLNLPVLDGFGLLKLRQKNEIELSECKKPIHFATLADYQNYLETEKQNKLKYLRQIPVLVTSAFDDKETIMKLRDLGVANFVKKPVNEEDLCQRVAQLLQLPLPAE